MATIKDVTPSHLPEVTSRLAQLLYQLHLVEKSYDANRDHWDPIDEATYQVVSSTLAELGALQQENRLSDADVDRVRQRIVDCVMGWGTLAGGVGTNERVTLRRVGAHALGLGVEDLRASEIAVVDSIINDLTEPF